MDMKEVIELSIHDEVPLGPVRLYRNKAGFVPAHQNLYKLEK
jgi:hypothetical protein